MFTDIDTCTFDILVLGYISAIWLEVERHAVIIQIYQC